MSANILVRQFGGKVGERQGKAKSKHLTLEWSTTNTTLRPGQRAALVLNVKLKPGMHLYAPGDHEYISVDWPMGAPNGTEVLDTIYPEARMVHLPATIPLKWTFTLEPHDLEWVPEGIRRGAAGS